MLIYATIGDLELQRRLLREENKRKDELIEQLRSELHVREAEDEEARRDSH